MCDDLVKNAQQERLFSQVARHDFCAFLARCFATVNPADSFMHNWHLELLADYLAACERGEIARLMVNVPPRSLKSITVSVAWSAWLLGHAPHRRIMAASYAQSLSDKHSQDCRIVMQSDWYRQLFPETQIAKGENEKHKFVTTQRGMRFATSIFGSATGEGGDVLIADDVMNPLHAMSTTSRRFVCDWFEQTFLTRLNDKKRGCVVVVMQRLHAEDLCGHLLHKGGWEVLSLPAVAVEDEVLGRGDRRYVRKRDELLQPARDSHALIERCKAELGSAAFAAQYQQAPLAQTGGMMELDWFGRF